MSDESARDRKKRLALEQQVHEIGEFVAEKMRQIPGPAVGYMLVMVDAGDKGSMAYVSNVDRTDMLKLIAELHWKLRAQ